MVIDLPFEGRKVEGSRKYRGRERVPKVGSRREETITEPINSRIGFSFVWTSAHHLSITMATQRTQRTCPGVEGKPCGSFVDILYSIYLAVSPILGDITKKATKTMGVLLRSSSNDEGPDRVWMALLEQHSPSSPVSHNLRRFTDAFSPTAPTTVLPIYGNPVATADASQNCVTIVRHSFLFLACSLASLISILLLLMLE